MNSDLPEHQHPEVPEGFHPEIPEQRESPAFGRWWVGGWIAPLVVAGFIVGWCLVIFFLIGDRKPDWKYGVIPYVPGQSAISSELAPAGLEPQQVELPEMSE